MQLDTTRAVPSRATVGTAALPVIPVYPPGCAAITRKQVLPAFCPQMFDLRSLPWTRATASIMRLYRLRRHRSSSSRRRSSSSDRRSSSHLRRRHSSSSSICSQCHRSSSLRSCSRSSRRDLLRRPHPRREGTARPYRAWAFHHRRRHMCSSPPPTAVGRPLRRTTTCSMCRRTGSTSGSGIGRKCALRMHPLGPTKRGGCSRRPVAPARPQPPRWRRRLSYVRRRPPPMLTQALAWPPARGVG